MAIAAAGGSPIFATRRSRRRRWVLGPLVALVVAAVVVVLVIPRAGGSGSAAARPSGSPGASTPVAVRAAAHADRHRHRHVKSPSPGNPFDAALDGWLSGRQGDITAAVEDLHGGREWTFRPGHPEHTASIAKVDILATLLHERQDDGGLTAEEKSQAAPMIEASNDDDASDLFNAEGGPSAVQRFDDAAGMHQTSANIAWGLESTTPTDQLSLLRTVLFPNHLLDRTSRDYEYGLMRSIDSYDTWGITAGPAGHAAIAFKNGWLPDPTLWQVNSIGSVYGAGRHYLIAVMTSGNPSWDYGIDTIEKISRAVWGDLSPAHS